MGPSATETFLAALGRCSLISILGVAEDEGVKIDGLKAEIYGRMERIDPPETGYKKPTWRFKDIQINLEITTDADKREISKVLRESRRYCTVCKAIEDKITGRFGEIRIKKPKNK